MRELKDWELHENETQCGMVLSNRALIDEYAVMSDSDPKTVSKYALFLDEFAEWLDRPLLEAGRADVKRFLAYLKTDGRARFDQGRPEEERRGWRDDERREHPQGLPRCSPRLLAALRRPRLHRP